MATDLDILRHKEWLGLLQPVGLVVSPPALIKVQAVIDRSKLVDLQEQLLTVVSTEPISRHKDEKIAWIENFPALTQKVLGWRDRDLIGASSQADLPDELSVVLPSYGEVLKPTYAVRDPDSDLWVLLIQEVAPGLPFDEDDPASVTGQGWQASLQAKFERLLRETGVNAGLLVNGTELRLVYAPKGESSGHLTFPVQAMTEVPGRLILGALDLLLGEDRLFNVPENQRLNRLLEDSRNYQAEVSTKLSGQVLDALWELLRGFQAADAAVNGKILRELAETDPQHIYGGLIATLMRLVFLLYAEDEGLMPDDEVYQRNYAVSGLYEKLREDAGNYPDTMDQRYGAWATLLSLFRLVYDGGGPTEEYLPARHGQLFDPDEYPFLEGRPIASHFATFGRIEAPRVSDGVIYRMLDKLLVLDGERLSYRSLDVEQIGSVYEAIMGYEVEIAHGRSISVRPKDVVVDVDKILAAKPADRVNLLKAAECELKGAALKELKEAKTAEDIAAAIGRRVSPRTPNLLAAGSLFLQPGEERRRSGSHYTPRKLTQPIVEKTLEPVLKNLGEHPTAEQLLDLKVCDLAMGSAAFLVEACRQLADKLVEAWNYHGHPYEHPHPPTPSPIEGEGEPERWEIPESLRQKMTEVAQQFRKEPTASENLLWQALRGRQLEGRKFRRQQPIGSFVVDFFCASEKLIVEVDGKIHESQQDADQQRQELLESLGLRFIRICSDDVENNLSASLEMIRSVFAPFAPGGRRVGDEGAKPRISTSDIDPIIHARRLVAQRCLYGVDKNPFAVNLARLSLWLVTLAKDLPFTFLDHALKCGDSLVGLTRAEIGSFGASAAYEPTFFEDHKLLMKQSATKALAFRQQIQTSDTRSDGDAETKQALLQDVERTLEPARLTAKIAVASFFAGDNAKQRQKYREEFGGKLIGYEKGLVDESEIQSVVAKLTAGTKAVMPFNWELEFPEVFERENPGFDAIVGNPPFLGGKKISPVYGDEYVSWLSNQYVESKGSPDLVAYFFRRAFDLIRQSGAFGLIATNTIAQGGTRNAGLRFICHNGGTIYNAQKRVKWPGLAAVIISVINIFKGVYKEQKNINDRETDFISAFLFPKGGNDSPNKLVSNRDKSFVGTYVLGSGFTFDDSKPEATAISEMHQLIEKDPRNAERIFPYIGGSEINTSPTHSHHRYIINFGEMSKEEADQWPDLMNILEEKVKPQRDEIIRKGKQIHEYDYWKFWDKRTEEYEAISKFERVLVGAQTSKYKCFTFLANRYVYDQKVIVFALDSFAAFASIHARTHENWVLFMGSSMKDDPVYTPSDCFETFPFPLDWETNPTLEAAGKAYYEFRADLMIRHNEGLTATYNRFHDPDETNPDILKLRELHAQMDRAVLDAYGWADIPTDCEFLLDYDDEDDEGTSKRKKPWRYRWPEEVHDEVLARLLKLNQERAEAEKLGRTPRRKVAAKTSATREPAPAPAFDDLPLFNNPEGATNP